MRAFVYDNEKFFSTVTTWVERKILTFRRNSVKSCPKSRYHLDYSAIFVRFF